MANIDRFAHDSVLLCDTGDIRSILHDVCALTGMGFAAVARVTESRWIACQVLDTIEFGLEPGEELDLKTTICDEIRESGCEVVIDHVAADPTWRTHHTPAMYGFESYASIPIILADGSFFGTLCAIDPRPRALSATALVTVLRDFAARVAAILDARIGPATAAPVSPARAVPPVGPTHDQATP